MSTDYVLFAAGIILGAMLGILGNLVVESYYQGLNPGEEWSKVIFIISFLGFLLLVLSTAWWILIPALNSAQNNEKDCMNSCLDCTNNTYIIVKNMTNISYEENYYCLPLKEIPILFNSQSSLPGL